MDLALYVCIAVVAFCLFGEILDRLPERKNEL